MTDGDFQLNVIGWYTPINVVENDFLNSKNSPEDLAKFGKTYSVRFSGDAETYLWTAKTPPKETERYWGHIQETSGRMLRFKVDKDAPGEAEKSTATVVTSKPMDQKYLRDVTAIPMDVYRVLVNIMGVPEDETQAARFWQTVKDHSDEVLKLIDNVRNDI